MPEPEEPQSFNLAQIPYFLRKRRWWIALTAVTVTLVTIAVAQLLPNKYTSEATVLVIQQQVPEWYVKSTTTTDVSEALQGMTQQVLSRSSLLSIIDEVGLYAKDRSHLAPEQLIERMRKRLEIQPLESGPTRKDVNSFRISFVADDAHIAQAVTSKITDLFMLENVKMREHQATATTGFLGEQLDAVKAQLDKQEAMVQSFKMQHLGDLPEQQQGNVQILASLSAQLQNTMAALSRAQEQKVYLESLLRGYQSLPAHETVNVAGRSVEVSVSPTADLEKDLTRLQNEKATLLSRYTPDHPDVVKKNAEIARAEASLARVKSQVRPAAPEKPGDPPAVVSRRDDAPTAQLRSQLEANHVELQNLTHDADQLKEKIGKYQERLNSTPVREQQLARMLRDYELLKLSYSDLSKKQQESGVALSLEKNQEGQQFRLVDPPSLPALPSSPKRLMISLGGAGGGLALGLVLAFLVETLNACYYTEKDLSLGFPGPLIMGVPFIPIPAQQRRQAWQWVFEAVAGCILLAVMCAAEYYVYRHG